MKSERAEEYLNKHSLSYPYEGYITDTDAYSAVEIAEEEAEERVRTELTRWYDIGTEFPEFRKEVLLKMKMKKNGTTIYRIGWLAKNGQYIVTQYARHAEVVAWRYIHDNPELLEK